MESRDRLGLCRFGFPFFPRCRRPQSSETVFRPGPTKTLRDVAASHITRGHIAHQNLTVRSAYRIRVSNRLTAGTATTHAGSQRPRVFRFGTNGGAPLQNPKTLAVPVAIRSRPNVPAASRGFSRPHHWESAERGFLLGRPSKDLAFAATAFPQPPEPPPAKRQDFVPDRAIRFACDVAACTSRAATSLANT